MFNQIKRFLAPPVFEGDEDKTRTASLLNLLLLGFIVSTVLIGMTTSASVRNQVSNILVIVLMLVVWFAMRRGHVRLASLVIVAGTSFLIAIQMPTTGGVRAPSYGGFVVVVMLAGLLLGWRAAMGVAALSTLLGAVMVVAESVGAWLVPPPHSSNTAYWIVYTVCFAMTAVILTLALQMADNALRRARTELAERKKIEPALPASEENYRNFENFPIGVYRVTPGPHGQHVIANAAYLHMFGYSSLKQAQETSVSQLYLEPAQRKVFSDTLLAKGHVERVELHLKRIDGTPIWGAVTASVAHGKDGEVHFDCAIEDITERKQAEDALRKSQSFLRAIIDSLPFEIWACGPDGRYIIQNATDHEHWGDYVGKTIEEMTDFPQEMLARWRDENCRALAGEPTRTETTSILGGEKRDFYSIVVPVRDGEAILGIVGANLDITERKQQEIEREMFMRELEARNAELELYAYTLSHDLKNPLITIRGFLGFLQKDALSGNVERLKTDVARITNATDRLQRLLNDLLELPRIGRRTNPPEDVAFGGIVRDAIEPVQGQLTARNIRLTVAEHMPIVHGDRARLVEVVQNLIDNAAKFMGDQPTPRIEIGQRDVDTEGKPVFFVRDNGIGIDPQYHERVFGLFNQLDAQSEGTGVGLTLVKRIVEVHGGRIWIESEGKGKGATFCFTLPAPLAESETS